MPTGSPAGKANYSWAKDYAEQQQKGAASA